MIFRDLKSSQGKFALLCSCASSKGFCSTGSFPTPWRLGTGASSHFRSGDSDEQGAPTEYPRSTGSRAHGQDTFGWLWFWTEETQELIFQGQRQGPVWIAAA